VIGGLIPNWFHEFVGETLLEKPKGVEFNPIPLLTSILVALGGLYGGWMVYRNLKAGEIDPLEKTLGPIYLVLKNKYYFDELYHLIFIRPSIWISEVFTYLWIDRKIIDGVLHLVADVSIKVGAFLRNYIDKPVVNGSGDLVANVTKEGGRSLRVIQTGRIQQYLIMALFGFIALSGLFYFIIQRMGMQ
jgi:NADH-quinone oxidoreductase subunit L